MDIFPLDLLVVSVLDGLVLWTGGLEVARSSYVGHILGDRESLDVDELSSISSCNIPAMLGIGAVFVNWGYSALSSLVRLYLHHEVEVSTVRVSDRSSEFHVHFLLERSNGGLHLGNLFLEVNSFKIELVFLVGNNGSVVSVWLLEGYLSVGIGSLGLDRVSNIRTSSDKPDWDSA